MYVEISCDGKDQGDSPRLRSIKPPKFSCFPENVLQDIAEWQQQPDSLVQTHPFVKHKIPQIPQNREKYGYIWRTTT